MTFISVNDDIANHSRYTSAAKNFPATISHSKMANPINYTSPQKNGNPSNQKSLEYSSSV